MYKLNNVERPFTLLFGFNAEPFTLTTTNDMKRLIE